MTTKLNNFPPLYYISLEESENRRTHLHKQFEEHGLTKVTPMIFKRFAECDDVINGKFVHTLNSSNKGASTSHLRAIRKWLTETNDPVAVFCEDDISFKTVEHWSFNWEDFVSQLPPDWECVQMMWVRPHMVKIEFRDRYPDDWAATIFMMKRSYGERLLSRFYPDGGNVFNYDMGPYQPIVENILFSSGVVYTIPLFVEETQLETTFVNSPEFDSNLIVDGQGESHHESYEYIMNWWRNHGERTSIEQLMGTELFTNSFDWGNFPRQIVQSLKREIDKEKLYEQYYRIKENDVVVDVGASVGPFVYSILNRNPSKVFCIEPSRDLFISLVNNTTKQSMYTPIIYINKAISSGLTEVKVFSPDNQNIYGGIDDFDSISFKEMIQQYGIDHIDFLKMDCEGGEYDIFTEENIDFLVNNVENMAIEFHLSYIGYKEKFIRFRDNFLYKFNDYKIFSTICKTTPTFKSDLSKWVFDDRFMSQYDGDLLVYIHKGK